MKKKLNKIPKYKWGAQNTAATISTVGNATAGALGIQQDNSTANTLKGAGTVLSSIPTPYTQIAGAALSTVGSFWGNKGSVNEHTGEINYGSGIAGLFGPSKRSLRAKQNRVKNSIVDREITEHLRAGYYMDPNNSANSMIFSAAEGGIAPSLTPAYLDSEEVVISPDRGSAVRLPYAEGTDTIPAMVEPYSGILSDDIEYQKGISFADLGDKIDKSFPDNTRAKQLLMQKALNAQEMKKVSNKIKNGVPAYSNGKNPGFFEYLMTNRNKPLDSVIYNYMQQYGKDANEFKGFDGSDQSFLQGLQNIIAANNKYILPIRFTGGKSFDQVRSMPIASAIELNPEYWNYYNQQSKPNNTLNTNVVKPTKPLWQPTENIGITTHPEIDNVWSRHKTSNFVAAETPVTTVPTVSKKKQETTVSKKGGVSKPSSGKKTTTSQVTTSTVSQEEKLTPEQIAESLRIADIGERHWLRGNITEPKQSFASLASSTPTKLKTQKIAPVTPTSNTANSTATPNTSGLGFDMLDYLNLVGPLANMFAPDAEAVRAHTISPVYGPTSYDVTPELRQIALNRATANYDANQVNPNTGANMAFKAMTQLNSDKATAAALSNKANVQNQLAFQNANIANSAMQFNANASHTAEVESAQNRAAARNIRRKGIGDFFTNIGKIRRDKKLNARDAGLYQAMLPYLEYGMTSDQLKKITELYA